MKTQGPTNDEIAGLLKQIADQLELKEDNPYRVEAFRKGAKEIQAVQTPLSELIRTQGGEALEQIQGIGPGLASTIFEIIQTGQSSYLKYLQTRPLPEAAYQHLPGIGQKLGRNLAFQLQVSSLEALEQAAHDGRLERVMGFGPKRTAALQHTLAAILHHSTQLGAEQQKEVGTGKTRPDVALLLKVDAQYRRQAQADQLPKLTPRRFNPKQEAWLPIMRTEQDGWSLTALYSNTAQAHQLGKTRDWVVIYYQRDGLEGQCTVVTEFRGPARGKRVIRGREQECSGVYSLGRAA